MSHGSPARTSPGLVSWLHGRVRLIVLVGVAIAVATYAARHWRGIPRGEVETAGAQASAPVTDQPLQAVQTTIAPPLEVPLADTAAVVVPAGGYLAFAFDGGGRSECQVHGGVRVLRGGDRRVNVFVVDRDGMSELEAGRAPRTWYESGLTADVALDFNVDGRSHYSLVIANTAAGARAKTVRLQRILARCAD